MATGVGVALTGIGTMAAGAGAGDLAIGVGATLTSGAGNSLAGKTGLTALGGVLVGFCITGCSAASCNRTVIGLGGASCAGEANQINANSKPCPAETISTALRNPGSRTGIESMAIFRRS